VAAAHLNGHLVAVSADDDTILRWDLDQRGGPGGPPGPVCLAGHRGAVRAVALTPLGGRWVILAAGASAVLWMWDAGTGAMIRQTPTGHADTVNGLATTVVDGRHLAVSASDDGTLRLLDLNTAAPCGTLLKPGPDWVGGVAISGWSRSVTVAGGRDGVVRLF